MAIAKMKRLELVALQSDRETLMEALLRLGCVEIREPEEQPELLHRQSSSLAERQSDLRRLTAALDALSRAAPEKTPLLAARPQISEKAFLDEKDLPAMLALADEITGRLRRISQLESRMTRLTSDEAALRPWQTLDIPLELEYSGPVAFITGTLPPTADEAQVEGTLAEQAPESQVFWLSAGREQKCLLLMTHRAAQAAALETLRSFGFSTGQLKGYSGTVQENLRRIEGEINDTRQARREESEAQGAASCALPATGWRWSSRGRRPPKSFSRTGIFSVWWAGIRSRRRKSSRPCWGGLTAHMSWPSRSRRSIRTSPSSSRAIASPAP